MGLVELISFFLFALGNWSKASREVAPEKIRNGELSDFN